MLKVTIVYSVTYYEIGIYSNCTGKANRTQLNFDAHQVSNFNRDMMNGVQSHPNLQSIKAKLIYKVYDVCDNFTYLAEIVQNLILDENLKIQGDKSYSHSSIIDFFMYTPVEMTTFVKNVFTQVPVYDIDRRIRKDGSIYNPIDSFVQDLIKLIEFADWEKLTIISLTTIEFPYLAYYRKTVETLQRMNVCLELYHINPENAINKEIEFIKQLPDTNQQ